MMVDYDNVAPALQLVRLQFLNFLLSKLSRNVDIMRLSNGHVSQLLEARVTWLGMVVVPICIVHADMTNNCGQNIMMMMMYGVKRERSQHTAECEEYRN